MHNSFRLRSVVFVLGVLAILAATSMVATRPAEATAPSGSVNWAEPEGQIPNYIFPMMTEDRYTTANVNAFQYLMYRPLYWYGFAATPNINKDLSLAPLPWYSKDSKTLTITLKANRWSNGEAVTASSLMLWLNLLHAAKGWWAAYTPGSLPDLIDSVRLVSATSLELKLNRSVNPAWFNSTQLSQITPMPSAWDVTSPGAPAGSGGCAVAAWGQGDAACSSVFTFLSREAGFDPEVPTAPNTKVTSYAANPIWQVVDGPWKLASLDAAGDAVFTANPSYTGAFKPSFASFTEVPTTSDDAELAALKKGSLDVGYLPLPAVTKTASSPRSTSQAAAGLSGYRLSPRYPWSTTYLVWNLGSTSGFGIPARLLNQSYVRQALQLLVAQDAYASKVYRGFAYPSSSAVPTTSSSYAARSATTAPRYPYNPSRAIALLKDHGWKVASGGVSTCVAPGTGSSNCGAGIPKGAQFNLEIQYPSDVPMVAELMNAQQASWAQAGINVTLRSAPSMVIRANAAPCVAGVSCDWQAAYFGGYRYQPGIYPLATQWLATGAGFNLGSYSNSALDFALAAGTRPGGSPGPSQSITAQNAPVLFEPTPAARLSEIKNGLTGVVPENVFGSLTPERWHRSS